MKLQISLIMILSLLLIVPFAFGATITLNASDMTHSISDHWVYDSGYTPDKMYDNNWATYSYPVGFYEATVYWTADTSAYGTITDAVWRIKGGSAEQNVTLPSECRNNPLELKATAHFVIGDKTFWSCKTSSETWSLVASMSPDSSTIYEQSLTITNLSEAPSYPTCRLGCPTTNCMFYDRMNYTDSFANCSYSIWSTQPPHPDTIVPTVLGENFYGLLAPNYMDLFDHDINYAGNYFNEVYDTYTVFWGCAAGQCEPFYDTSGQLEHSLIYKDFTSSADIASYHVVFYYDPYGTIYGFYETNETLFPFCTSCFEAYASYHKIEIRSFNFDTPTKTFVNGTLQYYARNSFSIFIDGTPVAYNLPLANTLTSGHVNIPKITSYSISKAVVLTALEIEGRTGFGETNTTENLGVGTPCNTNSECLTGLCEYHYCGLKSGNMPCTSDSQCISGECVNSRCTRADLWTMLDTSKTQQFGSGTSTNNFISLFLMIGIAIGMIILGKGSMGAMIASGASFIGLAIFFTLVGWLSPFIMIGAFIIMIIITILLVIIMRPGG